MTASKAIYDFLGQVSAGTAAPGIAAADESLLQQLGLIQILGGSDYQSLSQRVATLASAAADLSQEVARENQLGGQLRQEDAQTHSFLFHLEGTEKREAKQAEESQTRAAFGAVQADLSQKQRAYGELVAQKSLLDTLRPYGDRYIALTALGAAQIRDLGVRLYRVSDVDFGAYWQQEQQIVGDLTQLADQGSRYEASLAAALASADPANLWAIAIGLTRAQPDPGVGVPEFQQIYNALGSISDNDENRLMSSEVLFALPTGPSESQSALAGLLKQVRSLGVPKESALGVAAILLVGRREDGTVATDALPRWMEVTRSYESAALLSILNVPFEDLAQKFAALRGMFASWGFTDSEDLELASAYLALSDLPADGVSTKLAIIAKGMGAYLEYPLVASSILTALATLEANETLNLLEQAYEIVGRRAMPMSQAGLICIAVRMLHGIRNELVRPLDTTPTKPAPMATTPRVVYPRYFVYVPLIVVHAGYFSTFSGIEGAHPGHVHAVAGGSVG